MNQSKMGSLIEAVINTAIGFAINFVANIWIFPAFGCHITPAVNVALGCIYTVISVARTYCIRRWFNAHLHAFVETLVARLCK